MGDAGTRTFEADFFHRLVETLTVFGFVDGVGVSTDHFHAEFFQHTGLFQTQCTVQRGLTAHGWQQRIRTLFFNDFGNRVHGDGFDVSGIGHRRVGHDGGRVGVHQNNAVTLFPQGFTGLSAGVIELTGLTDHDRTGADDQNTFNVSTFWHISVGPVIERPWRRSSDQ